MIFLDTNVVIDLLETSSPWHRWSARQVERSVSLVANAVVVAECAGRFRSLSELLAVFDRLEIGIKELTLEASFAAGTTFRDDRRVTSDRSKILSDFLIGGHARALCATLLTRDGRFYRRYFPDLTLITPEDADG